jgi:hypothetical protein
MLNLQISFVDLHSRGKFPDRKYLSSVFDRRAYLSLGDIAIASLVEWQILRPSITAMLLSF